MPNRIIREGWLDSFVIDMLDANAERFFLRLLLKADDFGRFHAHPQLLKSNLFPLRESVRSTDMSRDLAACEKAGLLRCYEANGARYLVIEKFGQRTRAASSKFPLPPDGCQPNDGHMSDMCQSCDGHPRTYSYSETKSKSYGAPADADAPTLLPETDEPAEPHAKPPEPPPKPQERNPLFDALAACDGSDPRQLTKSAARAVGVALAEIRRVCPGLFPGEIARRAGNYRLHMPDVTLSASALAKWWAKCASPPGQKPRGEIYVPDNMR